jgi:putative transposase
VPRVLVTDKLASYQAAARKLVASVTHRRSKYLNNRAENSHQPTRIRERVMKRFASPGQGRAAPKSVPCSGSAVGYAS